MDKKKLKLFAVLSVLCLFCVLSEAYLRGYIQPEVKQASLDKTVTDNSQNKGTNDNANKENDGSSTDVKQNTGNSNNSKTDGQTATKKPASTKKKIQVLDPVRAASSQKVRVLVMTGGFESYYHSSVSLTCGGGGFTVSDGKNVKSYSAGKKAVFNMYGKNAKENKKKKLSARLEMPGLKCFL